MCHERRVEIQENEIKDETYIYETKKEKSLSVRVTEWRPDENSTTRNNISVIAIEEIRLDIRLC